MPSVVRSSMVFLLSAVWLGFIGQAAAGEPTNVVRQTTDKVIQILDNPQLQGPQKQAEREERLRQVAGESFDWQDMARRALAAHWRDRTPQQRQEFVGLFRDLVESTYIKRLESTSGERKDIVYSGEQTQDSQATVNTKVITKRNTQVPIDYRLHKTNQGWQVYDVMIEGVSLVNNYRSQFNDVISRSGYDELVQKMKSKEGGGIAEPGRKTR